MMREVESSSPIRLSSSILRNKKGGTFLYRAIERFDFLEDCEFNYRRLLLLLRYFSSGKVSWKTSQVPFFGFFTVLI